MSPALDHGLGSWQTEGASDTLLPPQTYLVQKQHCAYYGTIRQAGHFDTAIKKPGYQYGETGATQDRKDRFKGSAV
jgi:hypothetical protein